MKYCFTYQVFTGAILQRLVLDNTQIFTNLKNGEDVLYITSYPDATSDDACTNPSHYIVQNNLLVKTVTDAQLLTETQQVKSAQLAQSFAASLLNGFTSTADGTSRVYAIDPIAMAKWTGASTVLNSGKGPASITVKDFAGNKVTLTAAQFQQMTADGFTFYNNQEAHLWSLEDQVNAATTVDAVNAITW